MDNNILVRLLSYSNEKQEMKRPEYKHAYCFFSSFFSLGFLFAFSFQLNFISARGFLCDLGYFFIFWTMFILRCIFLIRLIDRKRWELLFFIISFVYRIDFHNIDPQRIQEREKTNQNRKNSETKQRG